MKNGEKVLVGSKYARDCSYPEAVGKIVTIEGAPYIRHSPYRLRGEHKMVYARESRGRKWEIHVDDILPISINNGGAKVLLDKEW